MQVTNNYKGNRKYKDRLFRLLFSEKEHLLELYNALNGSHYENADDLEITTLEDVLYMKMKNDVSILLEDYLNLYEHQSTFSRNLPLRGLLYFSELYRQFTRGKNIYRTKLIKLPTPIYVVFYNGNTEIGEERTLRLSDAFQHGNEQSKMELEAKVLNINYGHNQELMEQCRMLHDYAVLIDKVKTYSKEMELGAAIDRAIDECIEEDVLRDFLMRRRSEVKNSILTEYDEEWVLADLSKEAYEDGEEAGMQKGLQQGLQQGVQALVETLRELGQSKEEISKKIVEKFSVTPEDAERYVEKYWE